MRWDRELVDKLKEHPYKLKAVKNLTERIYQLESSLYNVSVLTDQEPVIGNSGKTVEDKHINTLMEIEELKLSLKETKREIKWIEKSMECLDDLEKTIIYAFYIQKIRYCREYLQRELGYSQTQIYRIREQALKKMCVSMYGRMSSS